MPDKMPGTEPEFVPAKNIGEAKLRIMEAVCYVQKTGKMGSNDDNDRSPKYAFASEVDLIRQVRPEMVKQGVGISCFHMAAVNEIFQNPGYHDRQTNTTKPDKFTSRRILTCGFRFTHYASNTSEDQWTVGEGTDKGDKASYKAMTGAMKYSLRQWLLIETGEDPDAKPSPQDDEPRGNGKDKPGAQEKLAESVAKIRSCPTVLELDKWKPWIDKQAKNLQGPLLTAYTKRRDELIRTTEAGANG